MNAALLPDEAAQHHRLRQFIRWLVPLSWGFTTFYAITYLLAPNPLLVVLFVSCFVFSCVIMWARQQFQQGQGTRAVVTICASFLGASIIVALAVPAAPTMCICGVLLAVVLMLLFTDGVAGRGFLWLSGAAIIAVSLLSALVELFPPPAPAFVTVLNLGSNIIFPGLLVWLIVQFAARQRAALLDTRAARDALSEVNDSLEAQVLSRTAALQTALAEVEARAVEQARVEEELRALNATLEARVLARTADLAALNAELRQSEQLLRVVVDSLADGLALLDNAGTIVVANPALGAICERAPDTLLEHDWSELNLPAAALVRATLADGAARSERVQVASPAGRRLVLDAQTLPLETESQRRQQLVVRLSDVTERVQLEQVAIANERLAASGRLAASVAHEVNSPLQAIQNLLFVVGQDDVPTAERAATLGLVSDEIQRVSEILRRLLSLNRHGDETEQLLDCNQVLERVLLLTARSLERQRVRVARELAPVPALVRGRADQLTQVALNLVINALDAMPQGGTLTVHSTVDGAAGEPWVRLEVRDTGQGIGEADREQIFEQFFTTKAEGTGLGLAVSRHIVSAHGGELTVRSVPGAGASFTVRLPAAL